MADSNSNFDAKLEAEIQAALGDASVWDMLDEPERPGGTSRKGSVAHSERSLKKGTVVSVRGKDIMVEFGPRSQGVCDVSQFDDPPKVGDQLEFIVDSYNKVDDLLVLSRKGAVSKAEWESLSVGQIIEARCTGTNKGGLEMEISSHAAFMPSGQVDIRHIDNLEVFVGEKMPCEIIELDRRNNRLILSRKAFMQAERDRTRDELLKTLEVGQELPGVVTSIQAYGCFVDIGGVDGLVHISDLSYKRINDPKEVVKEGEQITVKVMKIDRSEDPPRIGLGLKQTMADPFQTSANELSEGGTVTGRVTKIMQFGAFVEISPGVEGLIHISELSHDRVNRVESVVKVNEIVTVKVLNVDLSKQRIGLSLKAMKSELEAMQPRKADKTMDKLRAKWGSDDQSLRGGLG